MSVALKEDYMVPLFHALSDITQTEAVKMVSLNAVLRHGRIVFACENMKI